MKIQKGFTLAELLIAIAVLFIVLGFVTNWFLNAAEAEECQNKLVNAQAAVSIYAASPNDYNSCRTARTAVIEFNNRCGGVLPALPVPSAC